MDEKKKPAEAAGHTLQGPHYPLSPDGSAPDACVPLRLVLQSSGLALELDRPDMVIGRHRDADVRLPLPDVSRRHCRCVFADGFWQIFDLDSLNGVFVNHARVKQATLRHRDTVQIGGFVFEVDLQPGSRTVQLPLDPAGSSSDMLQSIADVLPLKPKKTNDRHRHAS